MTTGNVFVTRSSSIFALAPSIDKTSSLSVFDVVRLVEDAEEAVFRLRCHITCTVNSRKVNERRQYQNATCNVYFYYRYPPSRFLMRA
jgi:hypothetical protein